MFARFSKPDEQYNEAINTPLAENEWALHLHFLEYQGAAYVIPKIRLGEAIGKDPSGRDYQLAAKLFTKINRLFLSANPTGPSLLVMLKTLSWGMGYAAKVLSNELQIQEKYWKVILDNGDINPEYDQKYARYFNQFAGTVSTLNNPIYAISTYLTWESIDTQDQIRFALFCGMWNQLMDEGANIAQFVEMLVNFMLDEQACVQVLQALDQLKWSDIIKGLLPQFKENTANPQEAIQNAYVAGQNIMISAFFIVEAVELASGVGSLVVTLKKLKDITSATVIRAMIDIRKKLKLKGFRDPDNPDFFIVCATSIGTGIGSNLKFPASTSPLSRWGNVSTGHLFNQIHLHPSLAQCDRSLFRLNQANGKYNIESSDINQGLPEDFEIVNDFELTPDNIEGLPAGLNPQQLVVVKDKQNGQQWVLTRSFIELTEKLKNTFNAPAPLVAKVARLDAADQLIDNIPLRNAIKELGDNKLLFLDDLTKVDNLPDGLAPEQALGRNIGSLTEELVGAWGVLPADLRMNFLNLESVSIFALAKNLDPTIIGIEINALPGFRENLLRGLDISTGSQHLSSITNKLDDVDTNGFILGQFINGQFVPSGSSQVAGNWDYIVKPDGQIIVGRKHTFMSSGENVLAAGEIKFNNGKMTDINNLSGHYQSTPGEGMNFLRAFQQQRINTDGVFLSIYNADGTIFKQIHPNANARILYEQ